MVLKFFLIFIVVLFLNISAIKINVIKKALCSAGIYGSIITSIPHLSYANSEISQPQIFGLKKDRLLPCKTLSNCFSTSSISSIEKYLPPWTFSDSPTEEYEKLLKIINDDKYLQLSESDTQKLYIHATAKSAVPPTGIDDLEFLINSNDKIITYRSNSRDLLMAGVQLVGDGGSNRNRLESIKRKLGVTDMGSSKEVDTYMKQVSNYGFFKQMQEASQPSEINFIDNSVPNE